MKPEELAAILEMWELRLQGAIEDYSVYKDEGQSLLNSASSIKKEIRDVVSQLKNSKTI